MQCGSKFGYFAILNPREMFGPPDDPAHPFASRSPTFPVQEQENCKRPTPARPSCAFLGPGVVGETPEVPESFFIDPFTARSYSTPGRSLPGVRGLWNHKNYWVSMQDCWNCCKVPGGPGRVWQAQWGGWVWSVRRAQPVKGLWTFPGVPRATALPVHNHSSMIIVTLLISVSL